MFKYRVTLLWYRFLSTLFERAAECLAFAMRACIRASVYADTRVATLRVLLGYYKPNTRR